MDAVDIYILIGAVVSFVMMIIFVPYYRNRVKAEYKRQTETFVYGFRKQEFKDDVAINIIGFMILIMLIGLAWPLGIPGVIIYWLTIRGIDKE